MESDSVRSSGEFTVVDMWVEGKLRCISVSRDAINGFLQLPPDRAASMTDDDRREFVRMNLSKIVAAAKAQLQSDPSAENVTIGSAPTTAAQDPDAGDRRRGGGDRRKGDRRKVNRPVARERRGGGDRRKS